VGAEFALFGTSLYRYTGTTLDAYPDAALQSQGASRSFLYVLP
jgi:hypothetical protein